MYSVIYNIKKITEPIPVIYDSTKDVALKMMKSVSNYIYMLFEVTLTDGS